MITAPTRERRRDSPNRHLAEAKPQTQRARRRLTATVEVAAARSMLRQVIALADEALVGHR